MYRKTSVSLTLLVGLTLLVMCLPTPVLAGLGEGKTNMPNGRPFQYLGAQISSLESQIETLIGNTNSLEERLAAAETAIADLQSTDAQLQSQIDADKTAIEDLQSQMQANQEEIASLQSQVDLLQSKIAGNTSKIEYLQEQIISMLTTIAELQSEDASLQAQIDSHTQQITTLSKQMALHEGLIASLQAQINAVNDYLTNKAKCEEGYAIREVRENGVVVCEKIVSIGPMDYVYTVGWVGPFLGVSVEAKCQAGYRVTGGGVASYNTGIVLPNIEGTSPNATGTGWVVTVITVVPQLLQANAACIKVE